MPFRYYLIPFETDIEKLTADVQPKYLDLLGKANGLIPAILEMDGSTVIRWKQEYYVVRMDRENIADFDEIEKMPDVIKLDTETKVLDLAVVGVDTTGLSDLSAREDKDRAVTKWLIDEEKILSEVLSGIR